MRGILTVLVTVFTISTGLSSKANAKPAVEVDAGSPQRIVARCASHELATLDLKFASEVASKRHFDYKVSSETEYFVTTRCTPATCVVVNRSNKEFIVLRTANVPVVNQNMEQGSKHEARELVQKGLKTKAEALAAAQEMVHSRQCVGIKQSFSSSLIDTLNRF
jgi:hypothetical protein